MYWLKGESAFWQGELKLLKSCLVTTLVDCDIKTIYDNNLYIFYDQADGEKKTPAPKKPPPAEDTPGGKVERRGRPKGSTKAAIQARVSYQYH